MVKLEIVTGPMRAGKTTYAKRRREAQYIAYDTLMNRAANNIDHAVDLLVPMLQSMRESDVVLDGWFSIYNPTTAPLERLQRSIPHTLQLTGFYAPLDGLLARAGELDPGARVYQTSERIIAVYRHLQKMYREDLVDWPFRFLLWESPEQATRLSFRAFSELVRRDAVTATLEDVIALERHIMAQTYDKLYQTIPLPYGRDIPARHEDTIVVFDQASRVVQWRGKTVLDCGAYHGQHCFAAEDAGARKVRGIDATAPAVETARRLQRIWNYETEFECSALEAFTPQEKYDIVLCLNMLQYVLAPEQSRVVDQLFAAGDTLVWETYDDAFPLLDKQTTHRLIQHEESFRWRPPSKPRYLRIYERLRP